MERSSLNFDAKMGKEIAKIVLYYSYIKGTVSVISSDPPGKEGNARFTFVPIIQLYSCTNN